jgi:hypothetical protein
MNWLQDQIAQVIERSGISPLLIVVIVFLLAALDLVKYLDRHPNWTKSGRKGRFAVYYRVAMVMVLAMSVLVLLWKEF